MNTVTKILDMAGALMIVFYPRGPKCEGCPNLVKGRWEKYVTVYRYDCALKECDRWYK